MCAPTLGDKPSLSFGIPLRVTFLWKKRRQSLPILSVIIVNYDFCIRTHEREILGLWDRGSLEGFYSLHHEGSYTPHRPKDGAPLASSGHGVDESPKK